VVVLGTVPFVRYLYAPLGAGDRFNFVSSIGGALAWTGIAVMLWQWRRPLAVGLLAVVVGAALVARVERSVLWHRAAHDAVAIQAEARRTIPDPSRLIVLGPSPIQQQNIAAYLDQSNVVAAVQLAYRDPQAAALLTFSDAEFLGYPADQRVDMRSVSLLVADTEVRPG
jgi:hypothetical protein